MYDFQLQRLAGDDGGLRVIELATNVGDADAEEAIVFTKIELVGDADAEEAVLFTKVELALMGDADAEDADRTTEVELSPRRETTRWATTTPTTAEAAAIGTAGAAGDCD